MKNIQSFGLLAVISLVLSACTADTTEPTKKVAETKKQVTRPITGKPSAPITMEYRILTSAPKAGEEIEVEVNFKSPVANIVSSKLTSAENMTWLNSEKSWQIQSNKSGQSNAMPNLKVIAPEDGRYFLRFVAEVEVEGVKQAKPFTIAIEVGDGPFEPESTQEVVTDKKGQKVIIQKAESDH